MAKRSKTKPMGSTERRFKQCEKWLRHAFACSIPVKVRLADPGPGHIGVCRIYKDEEDVPKSFHIDIKPGQGCQVLLDTLMHEWAHAWTWFEHLEGEDDHADRFWLAFGLISRAWYDYGCRASKNLEVR